MPKNCLAMSDLKQQQIKPFPKWFSSVQPDAEKEPLPSK